MADEAVEAFGAVGRDLGQAQAARRVAVADLDGADDEQLAVVAAPRRRPRVILGAMERQRGLVDLDEARQRVALGIVALRSLGGEQPGAAIRTDPELVLERQRPIPFECVAIRPSASLLPCRMVPAVRTRSGDGSARTRTVGLAA